jgi:chromosome partitioning protein
MLVQTHDDANKSAHVIVVGNEKGGSGKSTVAVHLAIALLKAGQHVVTVDLDARQRTLTQFVDDRRGWAKRAGLDIDIPDHFCVPQAAGVRVDVNETAECSAFITVVGAVERTHDFLVIDTPGTDGFLTRLAHAMADTLVTPLNDSLVDLAVLGTVDPVTYALIEPSHYAVMVREARHERYKVDHRELDWVVLRNRLSHPRSRGSQRVAQALDELGLQLGFRSAEALTERLVYREMFPRGMTALDDISQTTFGRPAHRSHRDARQEVEALVAALKLPINEKGRRRAAARAEWFAARDKRLEPVEV